MPLLLPLQIKWEQVARDQSHMCNQAVGLSRCLTKVYDSMETQLKVIQGDRSKGKSSSKVHQAAEEMDYLVHTSNGLDYSNTGLIRAIFINVANLTLACRHSYLEFIKVGIKQDTLTSLRTAPLHLIALFPDHLISKAEEEICHHEGKHTPSRTYRKTQCYPLTVRLADNSKTGPPAWKQLKTWTEI